MMEISHDKIMFIEKGLEDNILPIGNDMDHLFSKSAPYHIKRLYGSMGHFFGALELDPDNEDDIDEDDIANAERVLKSKVKCDADMAEEAGNRNMSEFVKYTLHFEAPDFAAGPKQLADHFLSNGELRCVKKVYGDSVSFMICHGLRFYQERDCLRAKSIAARLLNKQQ
jgi:hypothetical protein